MINFFKKSSGYFILSKGIFHISLDGPLDKKSFETKAKEKNYPLFALALMPDGINWSPLRENSWNFTETPDQWISDRFPFLSSLCAEKEFKNGTDFYLQFAGSKIGPVSASAAKQIDQAYYNIYDLLLRATDWKDWLLIENKEWAKKLIKKAIISSKNAEAVEKILNRQNRSKVELRGAERHSVIATMWIREASEKKLLGACVDLSLTGAQILLDKPLNLKTDEILELSLRPSKIAANDKLDIFVELKGKVVWHNPQSQRLGLLFVDLTPNMKSKLQLLVQHFV